jgi:hypothetical protein
MRWRLGCGGVDKAALCGLRWQHAGVLISLKIELHPMLLVTLVGNSLPAEVSMLCYHRAVPSVFARRGGNSSD